jgi:hypothetical protein
LRTFAATIALAVRSRCRSVRRCWSRRALPFGLDAEQAQPTTRPDHVHQTIGKPRWRISRSNADETSAFAVDDKASDLPERHRRRALVADPHLDLTAPETRPAPRGGEMKDPTGRIGDAHPTRPRRLPMLVGQAHAHMAAPPATRVLFERRRRRCRFDHDPGVVDLPAGLLEQRVVEGNLDPTARRAEPDSCSLRGDALFPQAQNLEGELDALRQGRLGRPADRARLVLDDRDRSVLGKLDRVAAASDAERVRVHLDRAQAFGARGRRLVDCRVVDNALSHLRCVGALAVELKPRPPRTECVVRDETNGQRLRF